jgi:hypothetical protein
MKNIKYKTVSGMEGEVTEQFKMHGMSAMWGAYARANNYAQSAMLSEAHKIIGALLYGEITITEKEN